MRISEAGGSTDRNAQGERKNSPRKGRTNAVFLSCRISADEVCLSEFAKQTFCSETAATEPVENQPAIYDYRAAVERLRNPLRDFSA